MSIYEGWKMTEVRELKRRLGLWDAVAINVGGIIGVGIFRTPGSIAHIVDSPSLILAAWLMGALVALVGGLCYAELASCFPKTGGTYIYLREAYGRPAGFLFGWAEFSVLRAGSIAGVAYIFVEYLRNFIPYPAGSEKFAAVGAILIFSFLNAVGLQLGTRVQNILTLLKVAAILVMVGIIFSVKGIPVPSTQGMNEVFSGKFFLIAPALIPVMWTYGGWHQSSFMSGEYKDTKRDLPLSIVMSIAIVAVAYMMMNAAYLQIFSPAQMAGTKTIASDIFSQLYGDLGKTLVAATVVTSAGGALNSTILTGGRIPFAVAGDYPKMSWAAQIDPRFHTPFRSLMLNAVWASALVFWGNFDQLLFFFAFANWLFFALAGMSVFKLRKSKAEGSYCMVGYPWVPILFILSSMAMCLITIQAAPRESAFGAFLLLAGLPVYWAVRGSRKP